MKKPVGRFAPTPSGRMHLGNVFAAMAAWLSIRSQDGELVLRMEDLDIQRTSPEKAAVLREDLRWLGFDWDRETVPQSQRTKVYDEYFQQLKEQGLLYPCYCTRAQLHDVNAPPHSAGTYVYPGTCRNLTAVPYRIPAWRLKVPQRQIRLTDRNMGEYCQELSTQCGDFVVRRSDGMYVYQLAVVVDDGEAGVTEVVRGVDLLPSAPRQMYLQELLGFENPQYGHVPLLIAPDGRRLSKRDQDMDLGYLRQHYTPQQLLGSLACAAGLMDTPQAVSARELIGEFSWKKLKKEPICLQLPRI